MIIVYLLNKVYRTHKIEKTKALCFIFQLFFCSVLFSLVLFPLGESFELRFFFFLGFLIRYEVSGSSSIPFAVA